MLETIKSSREIDDLFKHGTRASTPHAVILALPTPLGRGPSGRVAVIAGKRTGNAVRRNRAKRVLRASVHRLGGPWEGFDVALIANRNTGESDPGALDRSVLLALRRSRVFR